MTEYQQMIRGFEKDKKALKYVCKELGIDPEPIVQEHRMPAFDEDDFEGNLRAWSRAAGVVGVDETKYLPGLRVPEAKEMRGKCIYCQGQFYLVKSIGPKRVSLCQVKRFPRHYRMFDTVAFEDSRGNEFARSDAETWSVDVFEHSKPIIVELEKLSDCMYALEGFQFGILATERIHDDRDLLFKLWRLLILSDILGLRNRVQGDRPSRSFEVAS